MKSFPMPRRVLALLCLLFLAAVFAAQLFLPPEEATLPYRDREEATLTGRVARKELRADETGTICVYEVMTEDEPPLRVQCYCPLRDGAEATASIGARVSLRGRVRRFSQATNPGEFDQASYYRVLGIACRLTGASLLAVNGERDAVREGLFGLRCILARALDACLAPEDAGIMRAMLLGDRSQMDPAVKELYQRSGIIHILAISGLHISVIGMGLYSLLKKLRCPPAAASALAILLMLAYGEMCGSTPSAMRAVLMFLLRLLADMAGRSYDLLTALALAAVLLVLEEPAYITYSGFQLSFLSVLGIGALLPAVTPRALLEYVPGRREPPWKKGLVAAARAALASLSVALVTLPVYMVSYHTFPIWSIFLNLLILPLMSFVLGAGIACMLSGMVSVAVGTLFGTADHVFLALFRMLCLMEGELPGAVWVTGHAGRWQIALYYLLLAGFVAAVAWAREAERRKRGDREGQTRRDGRRRGVGAAVGRVCWVCLALLVLSWRRGPELRITVLDVGQGDGIVIEGGGRAFLIDGGSTSRSAVGKYVLSPFLAYEGIAHLDAAILTHEDEDHMNGLLELLEDEMAAVRIDRLVLPRIAGDSRGENYGRLVEAALARGIPVCEIGRGDRLLDGALSITCLGPVSGMHTDEPNAYSTVLYLTYGDFSALFTGDVESVGQQALMRALAEEPDLARDLTVLKVAHHGSRYTSEMGFLERVRPRCAVISCGRNNRYGHPHEELMDRLEAVEAVPLVTAERGAVCIESDGRTTKVTGYLDRYVGDPKAPKYGN